MLGGSGVTIRVVLFDFGGVLVQGQNFYARSAWAQRLGLEPEALARHVFESELAERAIVGELPVEGMWVQLGGELGLDAGESRRLMNDFFRGDDLNVAMLGLARSLEGEYELAILSNAWSNAREAFVERFGLDELFDEMIISAEVGLAKPDPQIYHLTVRRLGVEPEEILFIDDRLENIEAAREAGFHAVHYRNNVQTIAEVRALLERA